MHKFIYGFICLLIYLFIYYYYYYFSFFCTIIASIEYLYVPKCLSQGKPAALTSYEHPKFG